MTMTTQPRELGSLPLDVEMERGEPCTTIHVSARTRTKSAGASVIRLGPGHMEMTLPEAERLVVDLTAHLAAARAQGLT